MSLTQSQKKTVLITGCSAGGIGHALCLRFSKAGWRVFATARRLEAMSTLAAEGIETLKLDVTSDESVNALVAQITSLTSGAGLNMLINNAGQPFAAPALDASIDGARAMFETNFFGVVRVNTAFQHLLVQAKGTIVHIGSIAAFIPLVFGAIYNASKAALHSYSNTLRYEVAPLGVQVVTVVTGGVKSAITTQPNYTMNMPPGSYYSRVAELVLSRKRDVIQAGWTTQAYADDVYRQLTGRSRFYHFWSKILRPAQIWAGSNAAIVRWVSALLPVEFFTLFLDRKFGFSRALAADAAEQKGRVKAE
ncbi:hypothetical protein HDU87_007912 [Geranomyces variabilis]|uniref:NAD(P)-binding protein n=1 Tax=Geranomyces variabilis TaxID=109894 RepID=A0AAD5TIS7_9FUNG|nr:hypothetical protein HDU87_007912 [Geranomyces variabilis]